MTDSDLALLLRSKSALVRLSDAEVLEALKYLESLGADFSKVAVPVVAPVVAPVLTPVTAQAAQIAQVLPPAPAAPVVAPVAPVPPAPAAPSTLASLEATIEKDVAAFFHPAATK
jgi:hypothetical protein